MHHVTNLSQKQLSENRFNQAAIASVAAGYIGELLNLSKVRQIAMEIYNLHYVIKFIARWTKLLSSMSSVIFGSSKLFERKVKRVNREKFKNIFKLQRSKVLLIKTHQKNGNS